MEPMRTPTDLEVAWFAGLYEGEGTVGAYRAGDRAKLRLVLSMQMTDLDIVERCRVMWECGGAITRHKYANERYKELFAWKISKGADVIEVYQHIAPYLGTRRLEQFDKAIESYKDSVDKANAAYHQKWCG